MRKAPLIFLSLALAGTIVSFFAPWHQPVDPEEWDDGEHIWGRNVFDTSTFVSDLGEDYPEDPDGVTLRQVAFWATAAGLTLSIVSFVFAIIDRRAWCLSIGWPAFLLIAGGAGAMIGGLMFELSDVKDLSPSYGLFGAGAGVLYLFVGNILASWIGQTPRELDRKAFRKQESRKNREKRRAAKEAAKAAAEAADQAS